MNKGIIFALGALAGAAGGSVVTYFIVKDKMETEKDEAIMEYSEYCEERIAKIKAENKLVKVVKKEKEEEDEKITSNEGVKKYHHQEDSISEYGAANKLFKKKAKEVEVIEEKESKLMNEITEAEFNNQDGKYEKQTIDIYLGDDATVVGLWAANTDNEEWVEKRFGKPLKELIGHNDIEFFLDIVDEEEGIGIYYIRNDELMIDFEVVIHDSREDDK